MPCIRAYRKIGTRDPSPGTQDPGPFIWDSEPGSHERDPRPIRGTRELGPSTWDPFWNIHTPILAICHMKDYMERNNFDLRSTFWKWLLHVLIYVWKVCHKNVTFNRQKLYEKVIRWIVATNALARFHIVTYSYAALFSRKINLCETKSIFYSLGNWVWQKMNDIFWMYIKNKDEVTLHSFRNIAYLSSYLRLKRFAWKRDYVIS